MCHVLYCDLSTLSCVADDIEQALNEISVAVHRVNPNLWLFAAREGPYMIGEYAFVRVHEYLLNLLEDRWALPNGTAFCFTPDRQFDCLLPDDALAFLAEHRKDSD